MIDHSSGVVFPEDRLVLIDIKNRTLQLFENQKGGKMTKVFFLWFMLFPNYSNSDTTMIDHSSEITSPEDQLILINIDARTLQFFEKGNLIYELPVRVGAPATPAPIGEGYIYIKRDRPVFRYVDPGPKQGQIIDYAECADGLKKVRHSKMRALGIRIKNTRRYSIHSTTCSETIGTAISKGCIGMKIDDMLILYPKVLEGAKIKIVSRK